MSQSCRSHHVSNLSVLNCRYFPLLYAGSSSVAGRLQSPPGRRRGDWLLRLGGTADGRRVSRLGAGRPSPVTRSQRRHQTAGNAARLPARRCGRIQSHPTGTENAERMQSQTTAGGCAARLKPGPHRTRQRCFGAVCNLGRWIR